MFTEEHEVKSKSAKRILRLILIGFIIVFIRSNKKELFETMRPHFYRNKPQKSIKKKFEKSR
ncbi:MAG: hypothetical protein Wins2KO_13010 [Winogradskyella sp.]